MHREGKHVAHRSGIPRRWLSAAILVAVGALNGGCVAAETATDDIPTSSPSTATATAETTSSPMPADGVGAEIVARAVIDADGDLATVDDQSAGEGWTFDLALTDGEIVEAYPSTSSSGLAGWLIRTGPEGSSAVVTERIQEDYAVVEATCLKLGEDGDNIPVGQFHEGSVTFRIDEAAFATYQCDFFNVLAGTAVAAISVWKYIDADGDLRTVDDVSPRSWEFRATFEDGVEVLSADPVSNDEDPAGWLIRHAGDSTRVVLTEVPQDGYRLVKASCLDGDSSDGMEVATTLDGNSLSFDVTGFAPFVGFDHEYLCDFRNSPVDLGALPTLPPTDAVTPSSDGSARVPLRQVHLAR
jgi:hypothetical protein